MTSVVEVERTCTGCNLTKPVEEFPNKQSRRRCRDCLTAYRREWGERNRDKHREYQRAYKAKDPERRLRQHYASKLKANYGITLEEYEAMLAAQDGHCAICPATENGRQGRMFLCVDHDHETGKVRGLLCALCNDGLGRFRDNPDLLAGAIAYLIQHDGDEA